MTPSSKKEIPDENQKKPTPEETIEQQLQDAREQVLKTFSAKNGTDDPLDPSEIVKDQNPDN